MLLLLYGWKLIAKTVAAFITDGVLSRGAAMAFYAVTSLAPLLVIVLAMAGTLFDQKTVWNAMTQEFQSLLGKPSVDMLRDVAAAASDKKSSGIASIFGTLILLVSASGVFTEMQSSLNAIWRVKPAGDSLTRLVRMRIESFTLVAALGFLLLASLVVSAALTALSDYINHLLPLGGWIAGALNNVISFGLLAVLFASIYKILPDTHLEWRDVGIGAAVTAFLFIIGKSVIGRYLGGSVIVSTYGAASAPIVILLWVYYSAQIFFLGAEFTRIYAQEEGKRRERPLRPRIARKD